MKHDDVEKWSSEIKKSTELWYKVILRLCLRYETTSVSALLTIGTRHQPGIALHIRQMMEKSNQLHWDEKVFSWAVKQVVITAPAALEPFQYGRFPLRRHKSQNTTCMLDKESFMNTWTRGPHSVPGFCKPRRWWRSKYWDMSSRIDKKLAVSLLLFFSLVAEGLKCSAAKAARIIGIITALENTGGINLIMVSAKTLLI